MNVDDTNAEVINIVPLLKRDTQASLRVTKRPRVCIHRYLIDEDTRQVTCSVCGKLQDPIDALATLAGNWERYDANRLVLRSECEELMKARDTLVREVKNLRAQKRRADETRAGIVTYLRQLSQSGPRSIERSVVLKVWQVQAILADLATAIETRADEQPPRRMP